MKRKTKKTAKSAREKRNLSPKAARVITLAKVIREKAGKKAGPEVYKMKWNEAEKQAAKTLKNQK